ncbi:TrmB family transcriptional regulator [Luteimonas granuli]|uniref:TrmB family transcriptional regulator n=1 Tax=Luteimonas granuli TaxID=1176533 RepID=A0A518N644_9GAMM|nr:TrmB family transcriptional regulator [Luteimonas granuli]QDW67377.1 TrmB family transcriptional regulator [Luteimonas granuli]
MSLTLGLTGMDPATEAAFKATFADANARLGGRWSLVPDADAVHVVVDMDSMYGPMSWLRLHAAGRQVIGLTSASRAQTDYRLGRPFDTGQLVELLTGIARDAGVTLQADDTPQQETATVEDAGIDAPAEPLPEPEPAPPAVTERTLAAWLEPGVLHGQVRYARGGAPTLLIDTGAESWHGPATLKSLAACFEGAVEASDFEPLDATAWAREAAEAGPAQPLSRLRWFGGLLAGGGELLPGFEPDDRFQLHKWPQTEREYPRHFRIATQMMKGPATVGEIAAASGVPEADVADFINANLATGFAEPVPETPSTPEEPAKARGLLGRLRNR